VILAEGIGLPKPANGEGVVFEGVPEPAKGDGADVVVAVDFPSSAAVVALIVPNDMVDVVGGVLNDEPNPNPAVEGLLLSASLGAPKLKGEVVAVDAEG